MNKVFLFLLLAVHAWGAGATGLTSDDPYEVLGVDAYVEDRKLTEAWKNLIKIHHPDYGGNDIDAQNLNEAYQFLKKNRTEYDRRLIPFRDVYKAVESRAPVPVDGPQGEDERRYRALYRKWLSQEPRVRDLAARYMGSNIFIFHGIMSLGGAPSDFQQFSRWQVEAYVDLINHLDLFSLTKAEFTWITLHNPVQALQHLMENYDNFNVRYSTLIDLMRAYRIFYIGDDASSLAFVSLVERMSDNDSLFQLRYRAFFPEIIKTLKTWLGFYLEKPRAERRAYQEQYARTKDLLQQLETFPAHMGTCVRLLFRRGF